MIAKGNLHQDGGKLAAYLVTGKGGERAELVELRGFASTDIRTAFLDVEIQAYGTRCIKPFFHAYVRLAPGEELDREQWQRVADRIEKRLGFAGQPRAVSFHHLVDGSTHLHVGWSRIDAEEGRAIDPGLYKNKLKEISRRLERELDLTKVRNERAPDDTTRAAGRNEFEQARRLNTDLKAIRSTIKECWERSDSGRSFAAALDAQGLILARGDRRDFVVIDAAGGDHALSKRITGATAAETRGRMADIDPAGLPDVDEAKVRQQTREAARAMQDGYQSAKGRTDDIWADFTAASTRTTEPVAPNLDRDAGEAARLDQVDEAARAAREARQRDERQAERENARQPSAIEARIIECAEQARLNGALLERHPEGLRIVGSETLAARRDQISEGASEGITVFGPEAFAARLEQAGITIARVTDADVAALDALRRDEVLARLAADASGEARQPQHFAELEPGDLAAVTRNGDVHRIDPDKLGGAVRQLAASLPSVTETRAAYASNREKTAELRAERQTDASVESLHIAPEALCPADEIKGAFNGAARTSPRILGIAARLIESVRDTLSGLFDAPEPPQQHDAQTAAESRRKHDAATAPKAPEGDRFNRAKRKQTERQEEQRREDHSEYGERFDRPDEDDHDHDRDHGRGRERER
jgi:hypothetical protein